ncbi:DUF411 domain-containing protein [Bacterioplanoides pacificum]|uniref:DUF411 domain-containing protein n=1 Tax=Bacterioplanoides pacificum TaxID=1171596 RepID=A0ABV7VW07_9GAMM
MMQKLVKLTLMILLFPLSVLAESNQYQPGTPELLVYKHPACGCCKKWVKHIENEGIDVTSKETKKISAIKDKYGIKQNFRSCHTAVSSDGYTFEGHVPAKLIHQFLSESNSNAIGLSVPAMPVGSPGMEVGDKFMPYQVLLLLKDGSSKVYAEINTYEDQF